MKYIMKIVAILLIGLAGLLFVVFLLLNYFFFSTARLPEGELLTETSSPNGQYTVNTYVARSEATVSDAVRGELVNHRKKNKTRNIYWQYKESDAEVFWVNEHVVSINSVELDVRHDVFDFRKD